VGLAKVWGSFCQEFLYPHIRTEEQPDLTFLKASLSKVTFYGRIVEYIAILRKIQLSGKLPSDSKPAFSEVVL